MPVPTRPPYYEGDPFAFEEYKLSAHAFNEQSDVTNEFALKWIQKRIKFRFGGYRQGLILVEGSTIDSFLNSVEGCVYNPEYLRRWIAKEFVWRRRSQKAVRVCARWARVARQTRVEELRAVMFSEWFMEAASEALPRPVVGKFEASISSQVLKGERCRLFTEFLSRIYPTHRKGRDLEEKEPSRSKCDQGHLQYGNDPRGLATPEGFASGGDPERIATPEGATARAAQGIQGTLDRKVQRHRARIAKDRDACKACQGIKCEELKKCSMYLSLNTCKRLAIVKNNLYCYLCLSKCHMLRDCTCGQPLCPINDCNEIFHPLLHWHKVPRMQRRPVEADKGGGDEPMDGREAVHACSGIEGATLLPSQTIMAGNGQRFNVLYDTGSQVTLISESCAKLLGAKRVGTSNLEVTGVGLGKTCPKDIFEITLTSREGDPYEILAHGVETLSIKLPETDLSSFADAFPDADLCASGQVGSIDMLIGLDNAGMMPKEIKRIGDMMLFELQFQNG